MNPPSEDIKDILIDSSVALGEFAATSGWSINISKMPDSPDTCIGIYDQPGLASEPKITYDRPGLQIIVRGAKNAYLAGYSKAKDIMRALHGRNNESWNDTRYLQILAESDIIQMGRDDNDRPLFSINFLIHRIG